MHSSARAGLLRVALGLQAAYYVVTGLWPIMHMPSFVAVTGPKEDLWLVQTVGGLIVVIGIALAYGASRRFPAAESAVLAIASAFALAAVDVIFVTADRIPPIYLADAIAEAVLIIMVAAGWRRQSASNFHSLQGRAGSFPGPVR